MDCKSLCDLKSRHKAFPIAPKSPYDTQVNLIYAQIPMTADNHPATPDELLAMLDRLGMETRTHSHDAVFTVEESSKIKQEIPGGHTKNLFLKDKKGNLFLLIAEGSARIRLNKIHSLIGASGRVSFANADLLMEFLGVEPGSVTAFAPLNDKSGKVKVIIDAPLLRYDRINCHPMTNTMTTTVLREDLLRFLEHVGHTPLVIQISEEEGDPQ